jgi:glycerol-3-phosphate O-acyltransferase
VRYRVTPEGLPESLTLDPVRPVCFVLPQRSWLDLFVLQRICREQGLPVPQRVVNELPTRDRTAFLYLSSLFEPGPGQGEMEALFERALANEHFDVQLVPISLFWGRQPDSETSLFKLLFADSVQAGRLRKLIIALVNGRNVFAHFATPVSFRAFVRGQSQPRNAMRKLGRIFNIHFLRVRTATLGPSLIRRTVLIASLLRTPPVRRAIEDEAREKGITVEQATKRARKMAGEVVSNYSTTMLSFLDRVLTPIFNRIFRGIDVRGLERVRSLAQTHEVLFLSSHRSHLDYLLISYVLYHAGVAPPHIAAGSNLNFWPIGGLLRRGGAFYLRRSFSGDLLYTAVFRAYVDMLLLGGYSISFYPEGGRSRTGRLLPPKTGLMAMVVESALRQRSRKVAVVPIFVGYDRVPEGNTYARELRGAQKQKESAQGLLKATKVLTKSFGKPYISFGEPVRLQEFAEQQIPGWRDAFGTPLAPQRPEGFKLAVTQLAQETMRRINSAAVAYPVALTAVTLLAAPQKAVAEADLEYQINALVKLLQARPYSDDLHLPLTDAREIIDWSAPIARLSRIPHPWGDVMLAEGKNATLLTYYRNNIQHLFAVPSLIASFFRTRLRMPESEIVAGAEGLYPFLRTEFFLRWPREQCGEIIREMIGHMVEQGLLERNDGFIQRPRIDSPQFATLSMLARIMGETLERYSMTAIMLAAERCPEGIERNRFEEDCRLLAERIAVLTGRMAPEFFDKALFRGYVNTLIRFGLVTENAEHHLIVDPEIDVIAERALELLGADVQQTILQLVSGRKRHDSDPV